MFSWKKNEGLSLYVNGHLKDHMKHLIDKPGLHHTDKLTRFEIAREILPALLTGMRSSPSTLWPSLTSIFRKLMR